MGLFLHMEVERRLDEAATPQDERRLRRAIMSALSQPSINRLSAYGNGTHFPTPKTVRALAGALRWSPLSLLRLAGYEREVICDLHDLRAANRHSDRSAVTRDVIEYAVRLFPRRGERYREHRLYLDASLEGSLPVPADGVVEHRPLPRVLERAYDVLGDASLDVDCRRAIAGELVRSWAYAVDLSYARSIEQSAYVRSPGIGEEPGIPLLPLVCQRDSSRQERE